MKKTHVTLVLAGFLGVTGFASNGAAFMNQIGVFRPSTGEWFLDMNGNHVWDGGDKYVAAGAFGQANDRALTVGQSYMGAGYSDIAVFRPSTLWWYFDTNNNYQWDGIYTDTQYDPYYFGGWSGQQVVAGHFAHEGSACANSRGDCVAAFYNGQWLIDMSSSGRQPHTGTFGKAGDRPVVVGSVINGPDSIAVYRPSTTGWIIDSNCNFQEEPTPTDTRIAPGYFGLPEDLPVSGEWNGTARRCIGVFRPSTGLWHLDYNCNKNWDGGDQTWGPFRPPGTWSGDVPVVGTWKP